MMEQMRGQDRSVYGVAAEVCLERAGRTIASTVSPSDLRVLAGSRFLEPVPFGDGMGQFSTVRQDLSDAGTP